MFESEELLHRVFCDPLPECCDAAYIFGQTPDNELSIFQRAQSLVENRQTLAIWIPGTDAMSGYSGQKAWCDRMAAYIPIGLIQPVPTAPTTSLNTLIEAQAIVRYAKAQRVKSLLVVATPFHQQRAVMTTITVLLAEYPDLQVYSAPGVATDWQATVVHSQGTLQGKCYELIYGEQERIDKYEKKGDLASREIILEYLRKRDVSTEN
ncbi:MAG: YdcF family protein [Cyanobacteria bacterium P01_D01_bin.56]